MEQKLAVVIPAYKRAYLHEALVCLSNQTDKDFCLYIGDDASAENLEEIIQPFHKTMNIKYHRFTDHIGAKYIVDQWTRCIDLIGTEDWIWLFSDDDRVDPGAIESFREAFVATGGGHDLYSFNTSVIDKNGQIISPAPAIPKSECSEEFAFHLLHGRRANCMADHIFSRAIFDKKKGFVKTLYGQGADWATSILFSSEKGICFIQDSIVYWRYSGDNITSAAHRNNTQMIKGHFQFIKWILNHFQYLKSEENGISRYGAIRDAAYANLIMIIKNHYKVVPFSRLAAFTWILKKHLKAPWDQVFSHLIELSTIGRKIMH